MIKPLILIAAALAIGCIEPHVELHSPDEADAAVQGGGGVLFETAGPEDDVAALARSPRQPLQPMSGAAAPSPAVLPDAGSGPDAGAEPEEPDAAADAGPACTVTEVSVEACAGRCLGTCIRGSCDQTDDGACAGFCDGQCAGQCEVCDPVEPECTEVTEPSEPCDGTCFGACSGDCLWLDPGTGACAGACDGMCTGTCRVCR